VESQYSKKLIKKYQEYMLARHGFLISNEKIQEDLESLANLYLLFTNKTSSNE